MFVFVVSEPEKVVVSMVVVPWFSIAIAPETWRRWVGVVVPIPTLPALFIVNLSASEVPSIRFPTSLR